MVVLNSYEKNNFQWKNRTDVVGISAPLY